ncbi:hypothetical protein B0H19DRAFT_1255506 [Mycena capillaripes]|nr:hypothetical protein B0H19DRAFT_1255506 [Mycena capillaripes]
MCLPLFSHRCWQYNPDLEVLFPLRERCMALPDYLQLFLLFIRDAPKIQRTSISYVAYCRIRGVGSESYPLLIVHLQHPELYDFPVRFKLQGFDGPVTVWADPTSPRYDTPGERSTFSVASVHDSLAELVGTWRYETLHTIAFSRSVNQPNIVDLLALADLSTKWDHTREGYPATLFLALRSLFNGVVRSRRKATPLPSDVADEVKRAVIDAFPTRRQRIQAKINFRSGFSFHRDARRISELEAENVELRKWAVLLEEKLFHRALVTSRSQGVAS